jgi:2-iminobutanoate/2-iminopropanoate deaminase
MKKLISTAEAPEPIGPYSQAVTAAGLLFASGQIPLDPKTNQLVTGDIEVQAERVLENLMAVLRAAGLGPEQVLKTTIYLADMADFPRVNQVYARFFSSQPPARSTVQAAGLPKGVGVEMDVIAELR